MEGKDGYREGGKENMPDSLPPRDNPDDIQSCSSFLFGLPCAMAKAKTSISSWLLVESFMNQVPQILLERSLLRGDDNFIPEHPACAKFARWVTLSSIIWCTPRSEHNFANIRPASLHHFSLDCPSVSRYLLDEPLFHQFPPDSTCKLK